jgi:hypothetical protein
MKGEEMNELPDVFYQPPIKVMNQQDMDLVMASLKPGECKLLAILQREIPAGEPEEDRFDFSFKMTS